MNRRHFLKLLGIVGAGLALNPAGLIPESVPTISPAEVFGVDFEWTSLEVASALDLEVQREWVKHFSETWDARAAEVAYLRGPEWPAPRRHVGDVSIRLPQRYRV